MTRQEANQKILKKLSEVIEEFPEGRFHQILQILDINRRMNDGEMIDDFHEESVKTLKRIRNYKKEL